MNILFKRKKVYGIIFRERGRSEDTQLFVGDAMHIDHAGACAKEGKCEVKPIDGILPGGKVVTITADDVSVKFMAAEIRTIYER